MDDLDDLVISPFQNIVDKGNLAIQNAGDTQPMLQAAQSLVKEGERALHKLEPLCRKSLAEYGDGFLHAVRANDDISDFREQLEDLLWEFDDYVEQDGFRQDKFSELQALSRKAGPKVVDILRRMDLPRIGRSLDRSALSPPTSPVVVQNTSSRVSTQLNDNGESKALIEPVDSEPGTREQSNSTHQDVASSIEPADAKLPSEPEEKPPRLPLTNPWDLMSSPEPSHGENQGNGEEFERRSTVATNGSESPVDPMSPLDLKPETRLPSSDSGYATNVESHDVEVPQPSFKPITYSIFPPLASRPRPSTVSSVLEPPIPEDEPLRQIKTFDSGVVSRAEHPYSPASSRQFSYSSPLDASPVDATHVWHRRDDSLTSAPGNGPSKRDPSDPPMDRPELQRKPIPHMNAGIAPSGLEPVHPMEADYGPIPVESEQPAREPEVFVSSSDCAISTNSSFYLNKGFCEGAHQVLSGGIGVKKVKKPGFATAATVARCTGCLYELDFKEIENDVKRLDEGTYKRHGIAYRLRFLQKCHLPTKRTDDIMYGCIFCVHQGRTLDESDATVFFSSKALLAHLARHPRRLPEIAGLTIIDGPEIPTEHANDFDLHFMNPPKSHPVKDFVSENAERPSGVAKEQSRKLFGQRLLADKSPAHEVAQGARLTGITWPSKYEGEWIFAWHDGVFASIPTSLVRLDAPPAGDVKLGGTSQMRAKARWKFAPKEKERGDWLKFDKDEQISNICYRYAEQWFWTGTNAKGKWGIFPQDFIDTNSLTEPSSDVNRANSPNQARNRSSSMFGRRFGSSLKKASGQGEMSAETGSPQKRDSNGTIHSGFASL